MSNEISEAEVSVEDLKAALNQRSDELAVIKSIQEALSKRMDIKEIYELVGDKLCQLFPDTQVLVIRTFDPEGETEHFEYAIEKHGQSQNSIHNQVEKRLNVNSSFKPAHYIF